MHDSEYTTIIRELREKIANLEVALEIRKGTIDILQETVNMHLQSAKLERRVGYLEAKVEEAKCKCSTGNS